jgi:hypothetical protein
VNGCPGDADKLNNPEVKARHADAGSIIRVMPNGRYCVWCADPASEYEPANPDAELCRTHLAEHEGLSVAELDRADSEQAAELADLYS